MQSFSLIFMFFPYFSFKSHLLKDYAKSVTEGYTFVPAEQLFNEVIDGKSSAM